MFNAQERANVSIGMIGMGWIGGSYTKDFQNRGYDPVCYSRESAYIGNKEQIAACDYVFIAVPTPTTPDGFDYSILRDVLGLVGKGKVAIIKSTMLPGTTETLQAEFPDILVMHSPEFLSEATAADDAAHPKRNIVGIPKNTPAYRQKAEEVLAILPEAPYSAVCSATEAEFIKYARNIVGYLRVIFYNMMYDVAVKSGADWQHIREAIAADPDNGPLYTQPIHKTGRGAAGSCFLKDFAAFADYYEKESNDPTGLSFLRDAEKKNLELLLATKKDLHLVEGIYGKDTIDRHTA